MREKTNRKLSDLLFGKTPKVISAPVKINLNKPIPVGHLLAVNCYDEGIHIDTLFIDHIDVCHSHTLFVFNKNYLEILPFNLNYTITNPYSTRVFYQNGANIEIIRIS